MTPVLHIADLLRQKTAKHWWFSGRILACHAGGPGSIPGQCSVHFILQPMDLFSFIIP